MQIGHDEVLQNDHHDTEAARDQCGDQQMQATQLRSTTGRPAVKYQHDDRNRERNVGRCRLRRPEQSTEDEYQNRNVCGRNHRPGARHAVPDSWPHWRIGVHSLLAEDLGVQLGYPIHDQGDQDGHGQGRCG